MVKAALFIFLSVYFNFVSAHEGPPFPVVVDHPSAYGDLSIWADPDVGEGTFIIFLESKTKVASVQVVSEGLSIQAARAPELEGRGDRSAFQGVIPYAREGRFPVEIFFNQESQASVRFEIDVTPPGPSRWQIWLFAFPFVALGFLWTKAVFQRRAGAAC